VNKAQRVAASFQHSVKQAWRLSPGDSHTVWAGVSAVEIDLSTLQGRFEQRLDLVLLFLLAWVLALEGIESCESDFAAHAVKCPCMAFWMIPKRYPAGLRNLCVSTASSPFIKHCLTQVRSQLHQRDLGTCFAAWMLAN